MRHPHPSESQVLAVTEDTTIFTLPGEINETLHGRKTDVPFVDVRILASSDWFDQPGTVIAGGRVRRRSPNRTGSCYTERRNGFRLE